MAELHSDNRFAIVPEWLIEMRDVSDGAFRTYALMARYANSESGQVFPSVGTLAKRLGVSDRTVQRALRELEEHGVIRRIDPAPARATYTYLLRTEPLTPPSPGGDKPVGEGGDKPVTQSREDLSREGNHAPAKPERTLNQWLFEEMAAAWYPGRTLEELDLTKTQRQRINAAVKELRDIGVDRGQITFAAREYRRKWPDMELTPQALVKHWHSFDEEAVRIEQKEQLLAEHSHDWQLTETAEGYRYACPGCGELGPPLGVIEGGGG